MGSGRVRWIGIVLAALSLLRGFGTTDAVAAAEYAQLRHGASDRQGADPYVYVPVPPPAEPYRDPGVQFFGRNRVEVPGAVTVNAAPYICDLDRRTFDDKQSFVAHLKAAHGSALSEAADPFVVDAGQVHFTGR